MIEQNFSRISEESKRLRSQVRKQTIGYILSALGLVAGLAWNNAITALIGHIFPANKNSILAQFLYAAVITLAVVFVTIYILRQDEEK